MEIAVVWNGEPATLVPVPQGDGYTCEECSGPAHYFDVTGDTGNPPLAYCVKCLLRIAHNGDLRLA